jgi:flagellar assembly factor FliW
MPQVLTKYFGLLDYQQDEVVQFPSGLPAFEEEQQFLVIEPAAKAPLAFLQSLRQPGLCFLALPVLAIDPLYALAIAVEDLQELRLETSRQPAIGRDIECLAVLAPLESGSLTANLLAPIVINRVNRVAIQAIRMDSTYSHQYPMTKVEEPCL